MGRDPQSTDRRTPTAVLAAVVLLSALLFGVLGVLLHPGALQRKHREDCHGLGDGGVGSRRRRHYCGAAPLPEQALDTFPICLTRH